MSLSEILVIDDDGECIEFVENAFKNCQNPILVAKDGSEALNLLLERRKNLPSIILLDIYMPGMTGFEFLEKIQTIPDIQETLIFILSTSQQDFDKSKAYTLNVAGYIEKPLTIDNLLKAVGLYCQWALVSPKA